MSDLSLNHVATYRAGSAGYYENTGLRHVRGTVTVEYDSKVYVYRKAGVSPSAWRSWIRNVFAADHTGLVLSGEFPRYIVE